MLGKSLASPLLTFDSTVHFCSSPDSALTTTSKHLINVNLANYVPPNSLRVPHPIITSSSRNWELHSTAQIQDAALSDEDRKTWDSSRQALSAYGFANEELDKILGKAFGQIHSPYWGEERKKEVPMFEVVNEILTYLKDLGLSDDDIGKILKKFPEVLGCNLENEVKANVQVLEKEWGIKDYDVQCYMILHKDRCFKGSRTYSLPALLADSDCRSYQNQSKNAYHLTLSLTEAHKLTYPIHSQMLFLNSRCIYSWALGPISMCF